MAFTGPRTNNQHNNGIIGNGSNNVVNSGHNNQFVNNNHVVNNQFNDRPVKDELDTLLHGYVSEDALHNYAKSPPECHPCTRKTVRNEIKRWIDNRTSPLLWLNGPVGVGKSVIAKTTAMSHKKVVATFFFSTSSDKSATTLFPTLAWQLARRIPETKQHIIDSLTKSGSLLTSEIEEQFDLLIVQPLKKCKIASASLHVMVIDGVDECTDENMLSRFLRVLVRAGESGDMPLSFIICSRPEPRIHAILDRIRDDNREIERPSIVPPSLQHRPLSTFPLPDIKAMMWVFRHPTLLLQEIQNMYWPVRLGRDQGGQTPEIRDNVTPTLDRVSFHPVVSTIQIGFSEECKEDIAKYLTDKFNDIPQPGESTDPWFEPSNISNLVQKSCGQFIYASTIVRLLDGYYASNPSEVLEMARNRSLSTPDLNMLYQAILERAKDAIHAQGDVLDYETELRILMDALAIVIVFAENITFFDIRKSFPVIQSLLCLERGQLMTKLQKMHSVLNIVPGESINVYHRSFLEFFQSEKRSGEYYMPYSKALRRFFILLCWVGLRYAFKDCCGQLKDDDRKIGGYVKNIALAYRRNYFKRSSSPKTLIAIHYLIHFALPLLFLVPFTSRLREFLFGVPTYSSAYLVILQYLFLAFFCLFLFSSGSFIVSVIIYIFFFHHSFILPLFYPFLHPHFVITVEILLFSGQGDVESSSELDFINNGGPTTKNNDSVHNRGRDHHNVDIGTLNNNRNMGDYQQNIGGGY